MTQTTERHFAGLKDGSGAFYDLLGARLEKVTTTHTPARHELMLTYRLANGRVSNFNFWGRNAQDNAKITIDPESVFGAVITDVKTTSDPLPQVQLVFDNGLTVSFYQTQAIP